MCGIVGYAGRRDAVPLLFEGLARLEYRGYDSAGVAVAGRNGLRAHKRAGRVDALVASAPKRLRGPVGIGHTRWATHGEATDANAHPHLDATGTVAVAHNGIVENAAELRATHLAGVAFASDTDTEVLAQLIARVAADHPGGGIEEAVRVALGMVVGAYGLAVLDRRHPDRVVVARNGSPVVLGVGRGEHFVASDPAALVGYTDQVVHLEDGEMAVLRADGFSTAAIDARRAQEPPVTITVPDTARDTGAHPDHMHKEIHEQPAALARALLGRLDHRFATAHLGGIDLSARDALGLRRVKVLGCGTAHYAGLAGAHLIESLARIPADAEPASEFRYRNPVVDPDTLYVVVSQSGETYDTLVALQELTRKGGRVLGVVNAPGSTIARACGSGIYLHAGHEVSVASTKCYTSMLVAFALLALHLGRVRDLGPADGARLVRGLEALPDQVAAVLADEATAAAAGEAADRLAAARSAFFVGRVRGHHAALEGAQKLKEVSYVHAEAYPAAELKHGPLALVTEDTPTVVIAPRGDLWDKDLATVAEVRARRGPVVLVTDATGEAPGAEVTLRVPATEPELAPILLAVPLQLLAHRTAVALGRDVDRPRNLAKSVTVE